ncbi:PAS domain-containing protein [Lentilitoribacter sp. EG35]|jgi:PAS domain S-box-containing protein|uniref:PAS domain-containing sensor histidine kinase n=1 Tax=Lentilitoribacter sp. EG35 TaxID=3234192 RepID=UPI003460A950
MTYTSRQKAALDHSQFLELVETVAGIGYWRLDLVNKHIFWSDEVYKIHDVTPGQYKPGVTDSINFYHKDDRAKVQSAVDHTIETKEPFEFELRLITACGKQKHVFSKGVAETDDNGQIVSIFGIFQDITERVQRERTHLLEQQIHRNFIEQSHDGFWDWYINESYIYISPRFWNMLGYDGKKNGLNPAEIIPYAFNEDYSEARNRLIKHFRSNGEVPFAHELRLYHKDGSIVHALCRGTVVEWDENGRATRMVGTHTDITTQKKLQRHLQDALGFQQLIMDNNPNLIFVKDNQHRIVQANPQFLSLYAEDKRDSIIGTTTLGQYSEHEKATFMRMDKEALETGYSQSIQTINFPNGKCLTYDIQKTRFSDARGDMFILAIGQNVTQREALIDKLSDSNEQLERFAHICSHDLHEPLRMVKSFTEMLEMHLSEVTSVDEKAKRYMDFITNGAKRGQQLITDVLAYSKISKDVRALEEVNVCEIISDVKQDLPASACLNYEMPTPIVHANHTQIYQLFQNLISNGVKYQPAGQDAKLSITWKEQDEFWQFCIADNGIGVEPCHQEKIFEVFTRLHRYQAYPGTGVGLSICKNIVERYGGSIWMDSKPEHGSKFYFQLPRASAK